ncbi:MULTISPECIES: tetratricopeptide repeat protein [unclassified Leeuwenhoekiella]|uniref:tetratricopeptide repeat protein n=1 Tax=unclassified Leeuwenhoekiella TaxID=2615029 RepID=UPI000C61423E|nr:MULTISPECIES: tetratricopeptide repeat protein [unclassified Leeuwenhoekiella]MAW96207.1 hypothetical protein [Leeuwenhoekiella sp.]MBA80201.1 hypothetical protein [Leeuwenhoekiella sp.]
MLRKVFLALVLVSGVCAHAQNDLLARNYMEQGDYDKAVTVYEGLIKDTPGNFTFVTGLIEAYQETEAYSKADSLILKALDRTRNNPVLEVELGYNKQLQGNQADAQAIYNKVIAGIATNPGYASGVARAFQKYSLLEEAVKTYETAREIIPSGNFDYQLASLYGEMGNFETMFEMYLNLLEGGDNFADYAQRSISRFITDDPANSANQNLRKVLLTRMQENPDLLYNRMLSWLFIQQKEYDKAFIQEKAIARRSGNFAGITTLAIVAEQNDEDTLTLTVLAYLIDETVDDEQRLYAQQKYLELRLKSANAEQLKEIDAQYASLLDTYGKSAVTLELQADYAHFLAFRFAKKEQATNLLEEALKLPLNNFQEARIKMELADILVLEERFNAALIYYSQIQKKLKDNVIAQEARFKVAKTSYYKGDFEWAKTQLKVLKSSAEQLIANDAQDLYLLITDNTLNDSTQAALKTYAQADLRSYQNRDEDAIAIYDRVLKDFAGEKIEDEALLAQAQLFENKKEYQKAADNYLKIIESHGSDILADDAHYRLANLYNSVLNLPEKAKEHYEQIIFNFADSIFYVDAQQKYRRLRGDSIN